MIYTRPIEWLLATMMLAWGLGLTMPGDTMSLPHYKLLRDMASEPIWAAWSLSFAAARFSALYINGAWRRSPLIRATCSGAGVFFWITITVCFLGARQEGPITAGMMWLPVLVGAELVCVAGGMIDAYHSRAFQRKPLRS